MKKQYNERPTTIIVWLVVILAIIVMIAFTGIKPGNVKGSLIRSPLRLWRSQAPPLTHHSKGSNLFRLKQMGRRAEGRPTIADYTVWTNELSREELMIIIHGIRNHRINQAKRKLQFLRAQRDRRRATRGKYREPNPPISWRRFKTKERNHIDGRQQELPF